LAPADEGVIFRADIELAADDDTEVRSNPVGRTAPNEPAKAAVGIVV
jgi:hypothetical protein